MRKVVRLAEAVGRMPDGVILMIGGFMGASV
jgi:acyl CoA:acetate/3-ketoacid CoA transferase alpha subunit